MLTKANISQLLIKVEIETKKLWGENMKTDNGYPYNFDLEEIQEMVDFFKRKGQPEKALAELDEIENSYFKNRDKIDRNKPENWHLMKYSIQGLFLESSDPTKVTDFFHYKLREIIRQLDQRSRNSEENTKKFNSRVNGIVLHYLMESNNTKFPKTAAALKLTEYLKLIGIKGEGISAYTKSLVHLRKKEGWTSGIFSRGDFTIAFEILKRIDQKAFELAVSEFDDKISEDYNSKEGKSSKFFRK